MVWNAPVPQDTTICYRITADISLFSIFLCLISLKVGLGDFDAISIFSVKGSQDQHNQVFYLFIFYVLKKRRTAGYISVYYFGLTHFLSDNFVYFFKAKF